MAFGRGSEKEWNVIGCTFGMLKEELNRLTRESWTINDILPLAREDRNDILIVASK